MAILSDFAKTNKYNVQKTTVGFLPRTVTIPLSQEDNFECECIVRPGDFVKEGQVIAEVSRELYGTKSFGASKIHSPIPGKVLRIKSCTYPNGKQGKAVEILLNGTFSHIGKIQTPFEWSNYSPAMLLRTISECGVVNTFSNTECQSLELDISKVRDEKNKKLFVRLFDEDPACQTDSILTNSDFEKILIGILITAKVCDAGEIIIAHSIENDIQNSLTAEQKDLTGHIPVTFIKVDTKFYPAGRKRELINAYIKQKKDTESYSQLKKSCIFTDSNTMIHVYNAVVLNIPVEMINVFVTGDCLQANALLKVCIGTSFDSIAKQCGGFVKHLGRIIVNGQINGISVNSLDTPVTKYVKSISFVSEKDSFDRSIGICMRCGRCRIACDSKLSPDMIYANVISGAAVEQVYIDSASLCTGCGVCSCVCPSKLPLTQVIKLLQKERI